MALSTTVVIASGASDSGSIPLGNLSITGVSIPTIDSAAITIRVSSDGGVTYQGAFNTSGEISLAASTGAVYYALSPLDTIGMDTIKLRTGTNASPVNQTATRTFTIHLREKR